MDTAKIYLNNYTGDKALCVAVRKASPAAIPPTVWPAFPPTPFSYRFLFPLSKKEELA